MTELWRSSLLTLRRQFEAASTEWPRLTHLLHCAKADATGREELARFVPGEDDSRKASGPIELDSIGIRPSLQTDGSFDSGAVGTMITSGDHSVKATWGRDRLTELAKAAGLELANLPQACWHLSTPTQLDTDLGIADQLWLGRFRRLMRRDVQLHARKQVEAAGGDASDIPVPEHDEFIWDGRLQASEANRWMLLLHNLAWRRPSQNALTCKRTTGSPRMTVHFDSGDDVRRYVDTFGRLATPTDVTINPRPIIQLPLTYFSSALPFDPFLCSALAIDILLAAVPEDTHAEVKPKFTALEGQIFQRVMDIFAKESAPAPLPPPTAVLSPPAKRAWDQWCRAVEADASCEESDDGAYDWMKENKEEDEPLAKRATWKRYLGAARKALGQQKYQSRRIHSSRSAVRQDELENRARSD